MTRYVANAPRVFSYVKNLSAMAGLMGDPRRGLPIIAITLLANALLVVSVTLLASVKRFSQGENLFSHRSA